MVYLVIVKIVYQHLHDRGEYEANRADNNANVDVAI